MRMRTDDQIAALYAIPPESFVSARDQLVKRLREEGDRAGAERVRGLRRPSPALWAVNQLAATEPGAMAALLQAAEGLRSAQGRLLAGEAKVELIRSAQAHRDAVAELSEAGRRLLAADERPASPAMVERIRRTLHSASLLEEARALLAEGRLTGEVPVAGFGFDDRGDRPEPKRRGQEGTSLAERRAHERAEARRVAERHLEDAERRRDAAHGRLRDARAAVERTEIEHAAAQRALAAAQDASARAREALAAATQGEERAVSAAASAEARAQRAREEETEAAAGVECAQTEVELARGRLRSLPD